jgi:hypothetical protein
VFFKIKIGTEILYRNYKKRAFLFKTQIVVQRPYCQEFCSCTRLAPPTCACLPLGAGYKRWRPTESPEARFYCLRLATYYFTFIYFRSSPVYEVTQRTLKVTDVSGQCVGPLLKRQTVQK